MCRDTRGTSGLAQKNTLGYKKGNSGPGESVWRTIHRLPNRAEQEPPPTPQKITFSWPRIFFNQEPGSLFTNASLGICWGFPSFTFLFSFFCTHLVFIRNLYLTLLCPGFVSKWGSSKKQTRSYTYYTTFYISFSRNVIGTDLLRFPILRNALFVD